jgi:hypothetical protein
LPAAVVVLRELWNDEIGVLACIAQEARNINGRGWLYRRFCLGGDTDAGFAFGQRYSRSTE